MGFIVSENETVRVWTRGPIRSYDHMLRAAYSPCSPTDITSMMIWDEHWYPTIKTEHGRTDYFWIYHYGKAHGGNYILPEEGRTYLRWLLKGPLVDNFKE